MFLKHEKIENLRKKNPGKYRTVKDNNQNKKLTVETHWR